MKIPSMATVILAAAICAGGQNVIVDTHAARNIDEVLALEIAARYHKESLFTLSAVMVASPEAEDIVSADAFLRYHGLNEVPMGIGAPSGAPSLKRNGITGDSVNLYRMILADAEDGSVDICATGPLSNLVRLLDSASDGFSDLSGRDLVAAKVRALRIRAGSFDCSLDAAESVIPGNIPDAQRIFTTWPTPIICTPYETAARISSYPAKEIREDFPDGHPVTIALGRAADGPSRPMWAPMTVLGIVDEMKELNLFAPPISGNVNVTADGRTAFAPAKNSEVSLQDITLGKAVRIRRWMRRFASGENRMPEIERGTVRVAEISTMPKEGADGEFIVLTNISSRITADVSGMRVICSAPGKTPSVTATVPSGTKLAPLAGIRLSRREFWPESEIPDSAVNIVLTGPDGGVRSEAYVNTRWWKNACGGTGRHFIALAWRPLVRNSEQWRPSGTPPPKKPRVVILHTNDTHSRIDDGAVTFSQIAVEKDRLRAAGENVILADAGDYSQGTAYGGYDDGRSVIGIMNATGYDVATVGNHEFDYGITAMTANVARCTFPVVSCNFMYRGSPKSTLKRVLPAYTVVTSGTARVAFVGVTTPTTLISSKPTTFLSASGDYLSWDFIAGDKGKDLCKTVQDAVNEAAALADYVVVLGHLGVSPESSPCMSTEIIANTTNFVAFIDGHSHSIMQGMRVKNAAGKDVILAQTGCYLEALGCLTLDDGVCVSAATLFPARAKDPEVEWLETRLIGAVEMQLGTRLAAADFTLCAYRPDTGERLVRTQSCSAGDFAADAYWWYAREKAGLDCDFALVNGGNVRADLPRGEVTYKTLRMIQPFSGDVGVIDVDGQTVLEALEFGAMFAGSGEHGGFLHAAGLRYSVNAKIKSGVKVSPNGIWTGAPLGARRIHNVEVYDRSTGRYVPLDPGKTYRVIGGGFTLIECGDGFAMFKRATCVNNAVAVDYTVLAEYVKAFSKQQDGIPHISSRNSPLASLADYPLAYEKTDGSGRIRIVK